MRSNWAAGLALAVCGLALYLQQIHGQAFKPATLVDAIDSAMFLTKFKEGAAAAGLLEQLSSPDFEGSVFVPTDVGFENFLAAREITMEQLTADEQVQQQFFSYHIHTPTKLFPLSALRNNLEIPTLAADAKLHIDRSVPGLVHLWSIPPNERTINDLPATVLQFIEVKGGKAVLYTIDRPLVPPVAVKAIAALQQEQQQQPPAAAGEAEPAVVKSDAAGP